LQERIRVYALAKELNLESKDLIDLCRQAGIEVKNQLSSLDPHQRDAVAQLVKQGGGGVAVAAPPKSVSAVITQVMTPVPVLHSARPSRREPEPAKVAPSTSPQAPAVPAAAPAAVAEPAQPSVAPFPVEAPPLRRTPAAAELNIPKSVEVAPPQTARAPPPLPAALEILPHQQAFRRPLPSSPPSFDPSSLARYGRLTMVARTVVVAIRAMRAGSPLPLRRLTEA